jgi:sporulation-control protein spo0M
MSLSETMREHLGATGARIELNAPNTPIAPGAPVAIKVVLHGGTRPARVDGLIVRLIEADRFWVRNDGSRTSESQVATLPDRRHLTADWNRQPIGELRFDVREELEPGSTHEVDLEFEMPMYARPSTSSCAHTLNIQADIKGQIDPTSSVKIFVGS